MLIKTYTCYPLLLDITFEGNGDNIKLQIVTVLGITQKGGGSREPDAQDYHVLSFATTLVKIKTNYNRVLKTFIDY